MDRVKIQEQDQIKQFEIIENYFFRYSPSLPYSI